MNTVPMKMGGSRFGVPRTGGYGFRTPRRYYQAMRLQPAVLWQTAICVVPSMLMLAMGRVTLAALVLFPPLVVLLMFQALRRDPFTFTALLVGTLPVHNLMRGYVPATFNLLQIFQLIGLFLWYERGSNEDRALLKRPLSVGLMAVGFAYWIYSAITSGDYSNNIRTVELTASVLLISLLGRYRSYLGSAFLGIAISFLSYLMASIPQGSDRLGMFTAEGLLVGNPQSFGTYGVLVLLASFIDGGRWLLVLSKRPVLKWALRIICMGAILLSTSRASWLMVIVGFGLIFWYDKRARMQLSGTVVLAVVAGLILITAGAGAGVEAYFEKTVSLEKGLNKVTNGRADQWEAVPDIVAASPVWGFGPGSNREIAKIFAGRNLIFHSLYLQMLAELGLVGLSIVLFLLGLLIVKCYRYLRLTGELMPLAGVLIYMLIAFTVPAIDSASGCFLGLALLSLDFSRWRVARLAPVKAAAPAGFGEPAMSVPQPVPHRIR